MGRGQTRIADRFSAIFGNRRGLSSRQIEHLPNPKDALCPPFARGTIDFNRRVALTQRLVEEFGTDIFSPRDILESYRSIYAQTHSTLGAEMGGPELEATCVMDLDSLVTQGICIKDGPVDPQYRLKDLFLWPKAHWIAFTAAIENVSAPLAVHPMAAGRMLALLQHWPPGGVPQDEAKVIRIYQEAYPGISEREAKRDLEELTSQRLCFREVEEFRASYSLFPVERWPAEHQQVYGATRYPW